MNESAVVVSRQPSAVAPWADRQDIRELAERLQTMMPGAQRLTQVEALTLAQAAVAHGLDPFNGELWFLKDKRGNPMGLMAGIKGHRRAAHKQMRDEGGGNYWPEFEGPLSVDEKAALNIPKPALAFRCKLRDTATINEYIGGIERLMATGLPWEVVQEIVGARPYTVGVGFASPSEPSKMTTAQLAMKRAEADALKRRFDLPFGEAVGFGGDDGAEFAVDEDAVVLPTEVNNILHEEAEEGEWDEVKPTNGDRPYEPFKVRQGVRMRAKWIKGDADDWSDAHRQPDDEQQPPDQQEMQRVAAMIGEAFQDNKDNSRHSVLDYLFGVNSTKALIDAEVKACLAWLEIEAGAWHPSGMAAEECRLILRQTLREQGQQEMEL
jgi:hypothetical protein